MSPINSKFAKSLRTKIEESKTLSSRKKRINACLKKVQKELLTVSCIMNQITENDEIFEKYNILDNFCKEFDDLWFKPSNDDSVIYDISNDENDPRDTGFCEGYY
jgi:hypothetical protein